MAADVTENTLPPTNEDTVGPYFPIYFEDPELMDISRVHHGLVVKPEGTPMILRGRVLDRHGDLANGALLEFWQANAKGIYDTPDTANHPDLDPWFHGYGRIRTASGAFEFKSIKPGATAGRAPCVTLTIFSDGISRIVTQLFFDDEPANASDPLLGALPEDEQAKLIARHDGRTRDGYEVYVIDVIMAGEGETPFFDDFAS
jgi:protocatechuate 3,4-dioxygenase alpha subunit